MGSVTFILIGGLYAHYEALEDIFLLNMNSTELKDEHCSQKTGYKMGSLHLMLTLEDQIRVTKSSLDCCQELGLERSSPLFIVSDAV